MSVSTYERLAKWASGESWVERSMEVQQDHLGPIMDACDAESPADLSDHLGHEIAQIAQISAFEDLLSRVWEDGSNMVDDYLKRRGLKESATSRDLLSAYRGTHMSLWEVLEVRDAAAFRIRDLVCGGEPIWIDHAGAGLVEPGDHIGARLLCTRRGPRFGLTLFPFDPDDTGPLRSILKGHIVEAVEADGCDAAEAGRRALAFMPSLITLKWLGDRSPAPEGDWEEDGDDEAEDEDEDDDNDAPDFTVRWPIKPGVTAPTLRAAFRSLPAMKVFTEGSWLLMDLNAAEPNEAGIADLIGPVALTEDEILLSVLSLERAQEGIALLGPVLDGLAEAPLVVSEEDGAE